MSTTRLPGTIAVIDFETTGFAAFRNDRAVEVAAVIIDEDGQIVREFDSLLNPERDVGPTRIHGITASDVANAPRFCDIAPLLVEALRGTIAIAGHNIRFDKQFINSEFSRMNKPLPPYQTLCTMHLAGGGKLSQCCCDYGIAQDGVAHTALDDARLAARLLTLLLPDQPQLLQQMSGLTPIDWPTLPAACMQPMTRNESRRFQAEPPSYLGRLVELMQTNFDPIATEEAVVAYTAVLDRVLEDRLIDNEEGDGLVELAVHLGLSGEQIDFAHREYVNQLALAAVADGVVTDAERRDLTLVARLLGQRYRDVGQILEEAAAASAITLKAAPALPKRDPTLAGKRVCFTGDLLCRINGQPITRERAEALATNAGLTVLSSVTKKLDILVMADPNSQSGKARKAREYRIRVMEETLFWKAIGVAVE